MQTYMFGNHQNKINRSQVCECKCLEKNSTKIRHMIHDTQDFYSLGYMIKDSCPRRCMISSIASCGDMTFPGLLSIWVPDM